MLPRSTPLLTSGLWCHTQCTKWRKSARATKVAKNEKKRQTLKLELEAELAAKAEQGSCSGLPNQTVQTEAAGGGAQAGRELKKADSVSVEFWMMTKWSNWRGIKINEASYWVEDYAIIF